MATQVQLEVPMPEFEYEDADGVCRKLSSTWAEGPALILWPRHRG